MALPDCAFGTVLRQVVDLQWFLTNSNEETVRPQPLRLDLLTEAGIQIAQAVLAWVGERFPSSKWLHEQPVRALTVALSRCIFMHAAGCEPQAVGHCVTWHLCVTKA